MIFADPDVVNAIMCFCITSFNFLYLYCCFLCQLMSWSSAIRLLGRTLAIFTRVACIPTLQDKFQQLKSNQLRENTSLLSKDTLLLQPLEWDQRESR